MEYTLESLTDDIYNLYHRQFYGHHDIKLVIHGSIKILMSIENYTFDELVDIILWCQSNCNGKWLLSLGYEKAIFEDATDAMLFKLVWS